MAWPTPTPPQPYVPTEQLVCSLCGSTDIEVVLRDPVPLTVETILHPPHPLTYGLVATCRICELAWKPRDRANHLG